MSKDIRGFKFRIYPTNKQKKIFDNTFYVYNRAWNKLLATYVNFREELNQIPFVSKNELFNYYTKHPEGKKNQEIRNEMYFNGFLNYKRNTGELNEKGNKLQYNLYNEFKTENGEYFEPYNTLPSMVMDSLIDTMKKSFEKMSDGAGFPKFKKYNKDTKQVIGEASFKFRYTNTQQKNNEYQLKNNNLLGFHKIDIGWGGKNIVIDKKGNKKNKIIDIGKLLIKQHRLLPNDALITSYTISRDLLKNYFISFTVESMNYSDGVFDNNANNDSTSKITILGVDRNATGNHITTSDVNLNQTIYNNELLFDISKNDNELYAQIEKEQYKLSKIRTNIGLKLYGDIFLTKSHKIPFDKLTSKYHAQKLKISKLHKKIRNRKKDKINNIAHTLTNNANLIIFEDLKLSNMNKTPKPKQDGNGVYIVNGKKRKSGLNKLLYRSNLYEIKLKTEIKAKQRNSIVDIVDPKYTSRTCPKCEHVNGDIILHNKFKKNKLFSCQSCGYTEHSDLTAALIIKNKYVKILNSNN